MRFSLFTTLACLAVSHAAEYHGIIDPWSFDVDEGKFTDWMGAIDDDTLLEEIFDFLDQHPREAVILRIQRGGIFVDSKTFLETFDDVFVSGSYVGDRAIERIYTADDDVISVAPTLGQLRGKVLILEDFETERPGRYGLPWNKDTVTNYNYKFSLGGLFLESKWNSVKSHLSQDPSPDSNILRITHTTASFGARPINIAARNSPSTGMNGFLGQYLKNSESKCFGIIVMDFPGKHLVQNILAHNNKYRAPDSARLPSDDTDTVPVEASYSNA
ncbi:1-phosphatidylinositol phosphodiesterase [Ceratocystis platani]|uniref:1-phosphatidylinositol phosphodiesterase n=1 Tax=Ceratocystis fimbriata f. sp. platani TaxID=88771 RepID=A0A0F8BM59_CERFI|nr:1-phosphatidylinositol phosphodiesterase [Ceratocystis platani]